MKINDTHTTTDIMGSLSKINVFIDYRSYMDIERTDRTVLQTMLIDNNV